MRKGHWEPIIEPPQRLYENSDGTLSMPCVVVPGCFTVLRGDDLWRITEPRKRWIWDEPPACARGLCEGMPHQLREISHLVPHRHSPTAADQTESHRADATQGG